MLVKRKWEAEDRQAAMDAEQARIDAEAAEAKKSLLRQVPNSTSSAHTWWLQESNQPSLSSPSSPQTRMNNARQREEARRAAKAKAVAEARAERMRAVAEEEARRKAEEARRAAEEEAKRKAEEEAAAAAKAARKGKWRRLPKARMPKLFGRSFRSKKTVHVLPDSDQDDDRASSGSGPQPGRGGGGGGPASSAAGSVGSSQVSVTAGGQGNVGTAGSLGALAGGASAQRLDQAAARHAAASSKQGHTHLPRLPIGKLAASRGRTFD